MATTGPRPHSKAELADRVASWLYMNTTTSKGAAAVAGPQLVQALDNIGVLDMAGPVALPDSIAVPISRDEAQACITHYRALDDASRVCMQHRLVAVSQLLATLAGLYRDAHNAWAADMQAAARQRMQAKGLAGEVDDS
jgi:hypothetical protein